MKILSETILFVNDAVKFLLNRIDFTVTAGV